MTDTGIEVPSATDIESVGGINSLRLKLEDCAPRHITDKDVACYFAKLSGGYVEITVQETKQAGRTYKSSAVMTEERFKMVYHAMFGEA